MDTKESQSWRPFFFLIIVILFLFAATAGVLSYIRHLANASVSAKEEPFQECSRHYAFVISSRDDIFWEEIFNQARLYGSTRGIYLEWIGKDLTVDYTKKELLEIAIASGVDGIILEGDGSEDIRELIAEANKVSIPVVTVLSDCSGSQRKSFVGIDSYDVGREYGRQIIREANSNTKEALILMNAAAEDTGQNIIFNGIQETLANKGNHLNLTLTAQAVMADSQFGGAEEIRSIFQEYYLHPETMPEIIVCLNEQNTVSVCQAVVDFNLVGQVDILGYFATETILNAIDRNVITASIAVDTQQLGIRSLEALDEYLETGYVSDFVAMDVNTVTKDNVKGYLHNASPDKG